MEIIRYNTGHVFKKRAYLRPLEDLLQTPFVERRIKYDFALTLHPDIEKILKSCPLINGFNYTFVDIKVQHLKKGQCPEVVGPHIDFRMRPVSKDSFELNHLWCSTLPTYFSTYKEPLDLSDTETFKQKAKESCYQIDPFTWYTYDRHQIHWGPVAQCPTKRLFIRVSQTMENFR